MGRTKISAVNTDPHLGNTYRNPRREAMTDAELLPEIVTEVERKFSQRMMTEFHPIVIFPDISPKGSSGMLTCIPIVCGDNLQMRDATHIDPMYEGIVNRQLADTLRAKRIVRVSECWVSSYDESSNPKTYIAPHLDPRSRDFLIAIIQRKNQTKGCISIMWEIVTSANGSRILNTPDIGNDMKITNPDLVL
jgi:hypothetical protein